MGFGIMRTSTGVMSTPSYTFNPLLILITLNLRQPPLSNLTPPESSNPLSQAGIQNHMTALPPTADEDKIIIMPPLILISMLTTALMETYPPLRLPPPTKTFPLTLDICC